jgi:hypothetical protein
VEDTTYNVKVRFDNLMPEDWRERKREDARRDAALELMEVLHKHKSYFTVRVLDEEIPVGNDWPFGTQYRVWFELTQVEQRKVVMREPPDFSAMPLRQLSVSAVDEVKARVKRSLKRLFGVTD